MREAAAQVAIFIVGLERIDTGYGIRDFLPVGLEHAVLLTTLQHEFDKRRHGAPLALVLVRATHRIAFATGAEQVLPVSSLILIDPKSTYL